MSWLSVAPATSGAREILAEPPGSQSRYLFQGAPLLKEVSRTRDDLHVLDRLEPGERLPVELDDHLVVAAHDEKGRSPDLA